MSAVVAAVATAVVFTGYSIYQGEKASKQQEQALQMQAQAQREAKANAEQQTRMADEAMNRANRKSPNMAAINQMAAGGGGGLSATMLTGPQGVAGNQLQLGKTTLLGG